MIQSQNLTSSVTYYADQWKSNRLSAYHVQATPLLLEKGLRNNLHGLMKWSNDMKNLDDLYYYYAK